MLACLVTFDAQIANRFALMDSSTSPASSASPASFASFTSSPLSLRSLDQDRLTTLFESITAALFFKTPGWHTPFTACFRHIRHRGENTVKLSSVKSALANICRHCDENPVTATPLESALTKCDASKPFRIRSLAPREVEGYETSRLSPPFPARKSSSFTSCLIDAQHERQTTNSGFASGLAHCPQRKRKLLANACTLGRAS